MIIIPDIFSQLHFPVLHFWYIKFFTFSNVSFQMYFLPYVWNDTFLIFFFCALRNISDVLMLAAAHLKATGNESFSSSKSHDIMWWIFKSIRKNLQLSSTARVDDTQWCHMSIKAFKMAINWADCSTGYLYHNTTRYNKVWLEIYFPQNTSILTRWYHTEINLWSPKGSRTFPNWRVSKCSGVIKWSQTEYYLSL